MNEGIALDIQLARAQKHSRFGIASFVISLIFGAAHFLNIAIAGFLTVASPQSMESRSPVAIMIGLALFGFLLVNLLGFVLGIVGLLEKDRKKVFSILGTIMNLGVMLGVIALLMIGLMTED